MAGAKPRQWPYKAADSYSVIVVDKLIFLIYLQYVLYSISTVLILSGLELTLALAYTSDMFMLLSGRSRIYA